MSGHWKRGQPNLPGFLQATAAQIPGDRAAEAAAQSDPQAVSFPRHLYPPEGVQTIDIRIVQALNPGEVSNLLTFQPQALGITSAVYITHYAVFNNGLLESQYSFLPTLSTNNGPPKRIYPYHGNPNNIVQPGTFLISLGLAPDLSNIALIPGYLVMNPQDTLNWQANNKSPVITAMGVRVVGYVDSSTLRTTQQFGG
jgi:hypothetical protein